MKVGSKIKVTDKKSSCYGKQGIVEQVLVQHSLPGIAGESSQIFVCSVDCRTIELEARQMEEMK